MSKKTLNQIIQDAGVETLRTVKNNIVHLRYNDKTILRPHPSSCYSAVLNEFGIDLKNYE